MATIKKTNIYNYLKSKFSNTASHIKMNGTQSAGSSDLMARADHVHPTDTSRAPKSHASSNSADYGVSTASNYGHSKASGTTPKSLAASASVGSETSSFARGDHVHPLPPTASTSVQGIVQMDSTPTESSSNAVTSGGLKTVLDAKQNEVETQAKVTQFTNKDRINISRLLDYMENGSGGTYYKLILKGAGVYGVSNNRIVDVISHQEKPCVYSAKDKLATVTKLGTVTYSQYNVFAAMLYKNGQAQTSSTATITFKLIDGTVLGTSNTKLGTNTTSGDDTLENYTYLSLENNLSAGIYYVYAEVTIGGSVIRSNILSVFVKDTNNKLDYNQWSGTEYNNNTTGITSLNNSIIESVNNWADIGECSFKITRKDSSLTTVCRMNIPDLTVGSNITLKLTVYTANSNTTIRLMDDNTIISDVVVPQSDTPTIVNLNGNVTNSTLIMRVLLGDNNSYCYLDNISAS